MSKKFHGRTLTLREFHQSPIASGGKIGVVARDGASDSSQFPAHRHNSANTSPGSANTGPVTLVDWVALQQNMRVDDPEEECRPHARSGTSSSETTPLLESRRSPSFLAITRSTDTNKSPAPPQKSQNAFDFGGERTGGGGPRSFFNPVPQRPAPHSDQPPPIVKPAFLQRVHEVLDRQAASEQRIEELEKLVQILRLTNTTASHSAPPALTSEAQSHVILPSRSASPSLSTGSTCRNSPSTASLDAITYAEVEDSACTPGRQESTPAYVLGNAKRMGLMREAYLDSPSDNCCLNESRSVPAIAPPPTHIPVIVKHGPSSEERLRAAGLDSASIRRAGNLRGVDSSAVRPSPRNSVAFLRSPSARPTSSEGRRYTEKLFATAAATFPGPYIQQDRGHNVPASRNIGRQDRHEGSDRPRIALDGHTSQEQKPTSLLPLVVSSHAATDIIFKGANARPGALEDSFVGKHVTSAKGHQSRATSNDQPVVVRVAPRSSGSTSVRGRHLQTALCHKRGRNPSNNSAFPTRLPISPTTGPQRAVAIQMSRFHPASRSPSPPLVDTTCPTDAASVPPTVARHTPSHALVPDAQPPGARTAPLSGVHLGRNRQGAFFEHSAALGSTEDWDQWSLGHPTEACTVPQFFRDRKIFSNDHIDGLLDRACCERNWRSRDAYDLLCTLLKRSRFHRGNSLCTYVVAHFDPNNSIFDNVRSRGAGALDNTRAVDSARAVAEENPKVSSPEAGKVVEPSLSTAQTTLREMLQSPQPSATASTSISDLPKFVLCTLGAVCKIFFRASAPTL